MPRRKNNRVWIVTTVVALVVLMIAGTWVLRNWRGDVDIDWDARVSADERMTSMRADAIPADLAASPTAMKNEVIRRATLAAAGREGFSRMRTLLVNGNILLPDTDEPIPFVLIKRAPNQMRLQLWRNGLKVTHGYDGNTVWRSVQQSSEMLEITELDRSEINGMLRHVEITPEYINHEQKGWRIEYAGEAVFEDTPVYKLQGERGEHNVHFYLCRDTFLEVGRDSWRSDEPDRIERSRYSDFTEIDGFVFAMRIEYGKDGEWVQSLKIDDVKVNAGILPSTFEMPRE